MKSLHFIKETFHHPTIVNFIEICESIGKKNDAIKINGFGINFSQNEIESIKIYYGFHQPLTPEEVEKLHIFGSTDTFNKLIASQINSDYDFHEYLPTGISFAIKINKKGGVSIGHFMMPSLQENDMIFTHPKIIPFLNKNINPLYHRKGVFTLIDQYGEEHQKDYYYIMNTELKNQIGKEFDLDLSIVPSIEWVLGKGYYDKSSKQDEKIVLQYNYPEVYRNIILNEKSKTISEFNQAMINQFGLHCVCPGFYKNSEVKSYYYIKKNPDSGTILDTITHLISKLG